MDPLCFKIVERGGEAETQNMRRLQEVRLALQGLALICRAEKKNTLN